MLIDMGTNAADVLIKFFDWRFDGSGSCPLGYADVFGALAEVERAFQLWASMGMDTKNFVAAADNWKREIESCMSSSLGFVRPPVIMLGSGDRTVLAWVSEKMTQSNVAVEADAGDSITELVSNARALLVDDDSLPTELRLHLLTLTQHVEGALSRWKITGDFSLAQALERLLGALKLAEEKSKAPDKWAGLWNTWVKPVAVQMIASAPSVAISFASITS